MQLVPAVTELIIAELLYLQYKDRTKPIFLYINSTGTTRADGETVLLCRYYCVYGFLHELGRYMPGGAVLAHAVHKR